MMLEQLAVPSPPSRAATPGWPSASVDLPVFLDVETFGGSGQLGATSSKVKIRHLRSEAARGFKSTLSLPRPSIEE